MRANVGIGQGRSLGARVAHFKTACPARYAASQGNSARELIAAGYAPETDEDERRLLLCYARLKPMQRASLLGFLESPKG